MKVTGYADRLSVAPGQRIRFMVSCEAPAYAAQLVRLIHGDTGPGSHGYVEREVATGADGEYPGRVQRARAGSYVRVPVPGVEAISGLFAGASGLTVQAWIWPTTPGKGAQGLVATDAFALAIGADGDLELRVGAERVSTGIPLRPREWWFVAASYDAASGAVALHQEPLRPVPGDPASPRVERAVAAGGLAEPAAALLLAAGGLDGDDAPVALYNGKLEAPRLFARALSAAELERLRAGAERGDALVAAWDFSLEIASRRVVDCGPRALHGETVQMPTRAVTGHAWTGHELCFRHARAEYGAIHFHDDDLEDAGWEPDFELEVPELASGVYAARLRCEDEEYAVPFIVRPPRGRATAPAALLMPTYTYVAYANERQFWHSEHLWFPKERLAETSREERYLAEHPELGLSLYDLHADGSGVCYSSRLRPIPNLGPRYRYWLTAAPRHLAGDLYLVDWLEHEGFRYDVVADEDLDAEGLGLLARYRVVMTGSHPEYVTERMLDALEAYVRGGGRLMYLGGNGFYWVTSVDPERPHVLEVRRGPAGTRSWEGAPGEGYHSTTGEPGGLWRHRGRPPNALVGVGFAAEGWDVGVGYVRTPASRGELGWIFEGVGDDEVIGDFGLALGAAAADEIDRADPALGTPPQTVVLASAVGLNDYYQFVIEDLLAVFPGQGGTENPDVRADMTYCQWPGGGAVFSVGSIGWTGSLSHDAYENSVSRVTGNVLRRFLER